MRKLLNTVYVTNEMAYLTLDGENLVCKIDGEIKLRIPFENIENIVCFNYIGCSPALMGKCVGKTIPINFILSNFSKYNSFRYFARYVLVSSTIIVLTGYSP